MSKKFKSIEEYDIENETNDEKLDIFKAELDSVNKRDITFYSDKVCKIIKDKNTAVCKYKLEQLEKANLEKDSKVKEYIKVKESIKTLKEKLELYNMEEELLKQEFCNHQFLYLMEYDGGNYYDATFKCLSCGKIIEGISKMDQVCVNNEYLDDKISYFKGNEEEYDFLKKVYEENKQYVKHTVTNILRFKLKYYNENRDE